MKIKEVYLANAPIKIDKITDIFDSDWHAALINDGLYRLRNHNDLYVYKLGDYIFNLDKNKGRFDLIFRERIVKG